MTSPLERRYRRCLRYLPASYRRQWAEEMVSALLDSHSGDRWPRPGEVLSVLALGLRLRVGGVGATLRAAAWDGVPYRLALLTLLGCASVAVLFAAQTWPALLRGGSDLRLGGLYLWLYRARLALPVVELLWLGAFLSLLHQRLRAAQWLAAIAGLYPIVVDLAWRQLGPPWLFSPSWTVRTLALVAGLAVPAVAVLLLRRAVPVERRWWLVALVATVGALGPGLTLLGRAWPLDLSASLCAATVAGTVGVLVARRRDGSPSWLLVMAIVGAGAAGLRLVSLPVAAGWSVLPDVALAGLAGAAALVALVLGTTARYRPA